MARPQNAMAHVASLICEGVFEKFPRLRFLFVDHDTFWVPGLMWHMDADWKSVRDYTPWVKRLPSEYIREHICFGSQPMEHLPTQTDLKKFSSGYTPTRFLSMQVIIRIGIGTIRVRFYLGFRHNLNDECFLKMHVDCMRIDCRRKRILSNESWCLNFW